MMMRRLEADKTSRRNLSLFVLDSVAEWLEHSISVAESEFESWN